MKIFSGLREFSEGGLNAFECVFSGQMPDLQIDPTDPKLTSDLTGSWNFALTKFNTTKDMARAVLAAISVLNFNELLHRKGLWAWLTFVMRDQLFVRNKADGSWRVGEMHRWYPSNPNDWQKGQRHLVRMPVLLLHSLGNHADHLLCNKPSVLPEIREQLTSQQDMFNYSFQGAARRLYFDNVAGNLKRGAGGKGAGSPRRLAAVRRQLDVTWDLEDLTEEEIINLLPREFDRFR